MPRKKTHNEFLNELKNISPDIEVLGVYRGRHEPVEVKCLNCGKIWSPSAGGLLSGNGCRECRIKQFSKSRTKTNEQFLKELFDINPQIIPLEPYINSHTKILVKCKECENTWKVTPKDLLHGYGCKKCASKRAAEKRKLTSEEFYERVLKSNPDIEFLEEFKSINENIKVRCNKCGRIWTPKALNILYGRGCPDCAVEKAASKHRKSQKQFEEEVHNIIPTIKVLGEYKNIDTPVECKCLVCGYIWDAKPQSFYNGHGCRRCSRSSTSFMEQFIFHSFAELLGESNVKSRDRSAIGMELDIYIPNYKLAIEPGSWSFHKNSIKRDNEKRIKCRKKGIRLITVYDSFPSEASKPFEEDCFVFEEDYNVADHINIQNLVKDIFRLIFIDANFDEKKWRDIEQRAYRSARAKNTEDFIEELEMINPQVEILGSYFGSKTPIKTKCKKCGHIWNPRPNNLLNSYGCPICSKEANTKRQTKSHEQFIEELKQIQPDIIILGKYTKGKAHIEAQCNVCGTKWSPVAASLLNGEGCPKCGLIKKANGRRKTQEQFENELFEANPNIEVIGKYTGTIKPIRVKCKICGYEWERVARKLLDNPHHKFEKKLHSEG